LNEILRIGWTLPDPCEMGFEVGAQIAAQPCQKRLVRRRVAIEAGVSGLWHKYVGLDGKVIGLHRFGLSAPGAEVMKEFGIDAQHVIDAAKSL